MKSIIVFLASVFIFSGCNQNSKTTPITSLELKNLSIIPLPDSIRTRAILADGPDKLLLSGSEHAFIAYDESLSPAKLERYTIATGESKEYRAIAKTSNGLFTVNVASPGNVYKSTDDGKTWNSVYSDTDSMAFYNTIKFWDDDRAIITGDPQKGCLSILITKDGGDSWEKIPCDQLPATEQGEANFAASNSCIDVVGSHAWIGTGGKKARVFHTPDYGETWEVFQTPITEGGQMTGIFSIDFFDENLGVAYGGDWGNKIFSTKNKAITKDGGKTWALVSDGKGPGYRSCVKFHPKGNGNVIVAAGSEGVDYSVDQGITWSQLTAEGFYTIDITEDGKTIWMGGVGRIAKAELVY